MPGCAICFGELCGSIGAAMPCGHVFHAPCYEKWVATLQEQAHDEAEDDLFVRRSGPVIQTCPMCVQKVVNFQRIFFDSVASPLREDDYMSLYQQAKEEIEQLRREYRATKSRYEGAFLAQSLSHQETLDECLKIMELERSEKEKLEASFELYRHGYKEELKRLEDVVDEHIKLNRRVENEHEKELKRLEDLLKKRDDEKQKWRNVAIKKTRDKVKLIEDIKRKDDEINKLRNNPSSGSTTISAPIVKLNKKRAATMYFK